MLAKGYIMTSKAQEDSMTQFNAVTALAHLGYYAAHCKDVLAFLRQMMGALRSHKSTTIRPLRCSAKTLYFSVSSYSHISFTSSSRFFLCWLLLSTSLFLPVLSMSCFMDGLFFLFVA
jgi:hypothetical protein